MPEAKIRHKTAADMPKIRRRKQGLNLHHIPIRFESDFQIDCNFESRMLHQFKKFPQTKLGIRWEVVGNWNGWFRFPFGWVYCNIRNLVKSSSPRTHEIFNFIYYTPLCHCEWWTYCYWHCLKSFSWYTLPNWWTITMILLYPQNFSWLSVW